MFETQLDSEAETRFRLGEVEGLRLAAKGRLVAVALVGLYSLSAFDSHLLHNTLLYAVFFGVLALAQLGIYGSRFDRPWVKYVFVLAEIALLAEAVLTPNPLNPNPWPAQMVYRYDNFLYFFVLLAVSTFSYAPSLVLWTGVATSIVWGIGFAWIMSRHDTVTFSQLAPTASSTEALHHFVNPNVVLVSGRVKEMLIVIIMAGLLSVVVWRGRRIVQRQFAAEREREFLRETFGKYVPKSVARAIIADRGILKPQQRTATVLFADVESFTAIAESMAPADVVMMLNEYFSAVADAIARNRGVINQFQGDAVLATFNVPLDDEEHAAHALQAALEIQRIVERRTFRGRRLGSRIGINTGSVVAGSVGGSDRLSYTVHGDAVNLAARLEQLNKKYASRILLSDATALLAGDSFECTPVGRLTVRGKSQEITVVRLMPESADQPR